MAETTRHHLPVRGGRSATAPATWGQRSIWTDIEYMMPDTSFYNSTLFVDVPPGASREGVFAALTATVARHDSLRTLFQQAQAPAPSDAGPADSGAPTAGRGALTQTVEAEGSLAVDVVEAYTDRDDLAEVAGRMDAEVTSHRFDHAREWPVRATVGVVDGAIVVVGLCLSHLAADNGSLRVVRRDLEQLLRVAGSAEGVRAAAAGLPAPGLQPVELAEEEGSPSGQRMLDKALEHWRGELAAMPPTVFPGPPLPPESPRYPALWLRSRAVALAADALALRHGASSSVVLLAATALLLGRNGGTDRAALVLISGNRTGPALAGFVGNLVQDVLATVDLSGPTFGDVVRAAWGVSVRAYRNGRCDREQFTALRARAAVERGSELELTCYFNDVRGATRPAAESCDAAGVRAATTRTTTGEGPGTERDNLSFFLRVGAWGPNDEQVELSVRADSCRLPRERIRELLSGVEALLVAAVERPGEPVASLLASLPGADADVSPSGPDPEPEAATVPEPQARPVDAGALG